MNAQKRFDAAMSESLKVLVGRWNWMLLWPIYPKARVVATNFGTKPPAIADDGRRGPDNKGALDAEPTTEEPSWFADIPTNQEINRLVAEARVSQSIKRFRPGLNLPDKPMKNSPIKKPHE